MVGGLSFCGEWVRVDPNVYVPRLQTSSLARRAVTLLPSHGVAVDLCTGSGAIAVTLGRRRPGARVVGTDIDPAACRCAAANGVEVYEGDLDEPLPGELVGAADVVVAVAPYVPSDDVRLLPRDSRDYEPRLALDGGPDGLDVLRRVVLAGARLLRRGGVLLLELGGGQADALAPDLRAAGVGPPTVRFDDEGDVRGVEATRVI